MASVNGMFETAPDNRIRPETPSRISWVISDANRARRRRPIGRRSPEKATGDGEGEQSVDEGSGIEQTSVGDVGVPPLQAALEVSLPFPLKILLSFSLLPVIDLSIWKKWRVLFHRLSDDSSSLVCDSLGVSYPVMIRLSALFLSLPIFLGFCVGEICSI